MAAALAERLRQRIRESGPIPFAEWMAEALYDDREGFYRQGTHPAGTARGAHFATSPTLHPFFAHAIARDLADAWAAAGKPATWEIVEFGAGTGALARDAMWELRRLGVPALWSAIDIRPGQPIKGGRWLPEPPASYDAVVANEFLDALPLDVVEKHGGAWHIMGVGLEPAGPGGAEVFSWAAVRKTATPPGGDAEPDGSRRILMPAVEPWMARVAKAGIKVGLIVDYGQPGPSRDVRAFRGHDFADPLSEPGTVDLTADVDFRALAFLVIEHGFDVDVETQERFLMRHGAFEAINKIDRTTLEGTSSYLRMRQLLLPTGFGSAFLVAKIKPLPP